MSAHARVVPGRQLARLVAVCAVLTTIACGVARRPIVDTGTKPPQTGGTISGMVRAAGSNAPLDARRVTAVDVSSGQKYETATAVNGGYTMKVPAGRYRLEVELRDGESLVERPSELSISQSDLDAQRDFRISVGPPRA